MEILVVSERFTFAAKERICQSKKYRKKDCHFSRTQKPLIDTTESISCILLRRRTRLSHLLFPLSVSVPFNPFLEALFFTMSQAHRPTWNPAQGRETKAGSQQISKLSLAAHTKLKFRQPGQTNTSDVARRDLKAELLAAERAALDKKRKTEGLPPLAPLGSQQDGQLRIEGAKDGEEDETAAKRRKILEEAAEMDKDDESESEEEEGESKGKGKAEDDEDEDDDDE